MTADVSRLRLLLVSFAGWINRHQQEVIEYLVEENHVLREQVKDRRLRLPCSRSTNCSTASASGSSPKPIAPRSDDPAARGVL